MSRNWCIKNHTLEEVLLNVFCLNLRNRKRKSEMRIIHTIGKSIHGKEMTNEHSVRKQAKWKRYMCACVFVYMFSE